MERLKNRSTSSKIELKMPHARPWKVGFTELNLTTLRKLVVDLWTLWLKVADRQLFFYNIFYLLKNKIAFKNNKKNTK